MTTVKKSIWLELCDGERAERRFQVILNDLIIQLELFGVQFITGGTSAVF